MAFDQTMRRRILEKHMPEHERFHLVPQYHKDFEQHYKEIVDNGGEGCVLKARSAMYASRHSSRKTNAWMKVKEAYRDA